jgi:HSP20 family protein
MLMRFDPFRELDRRTQQTWGPSRPSMPMDAYLHGDHFFVHLDLPGVDPETIDLTVEKNVVTVRAERSWARQEGDEILVSERPQGTFSRQLFLGDTLDPDHLDAEYSNGVLTLTIPVAEAAKPRRITVSATNGGSAAVEATSSAA